MATGERIQSPLALCVGKKIHDLRKERGMKQETLATAVGYTNRSTIAQIENGLTLPSVDKVVEIARALGVRPGDLLDEWGHDVGQVYHRWLVWSQERQKEIVKDLRAMASRIEQMSPLPS